MLDSYRYLIIDFINVSKDTNITGKKAGSNDSSHTHLHLQFASKVIGCSLQTVLVISVRRKDASFLFFNLKVFQCRKTV